MPRRLVFGAAALLLALLGACTLLTSTDGLAGPRSAEPDSGAGTTAGDGSAGPGPGPAPDGGDAGGPTTTSGSDGGRSSAYRDAVMADGPAAYFRFEDVTGNACVDEISGSRFACVYGGNGSQRGVPGVASSAAVRLTPDSTVSISESVLDFSQPFSVELWIELDAPAPATGLASSMIGLTDTTRIGFTAFLWNTTGAFRTEMWNTDFQSYTVAASAPSAGVWHHIVVGHDASGDFSYFDGAKSSGGQPQGDAGNPKTNVPLVFTGFAGRLDELAWYDHALSSARVLVHDGLD